MKYTDEHLQVLENQLVALNAMAFYDCIDVVLDSYFSIIDEPDTYDAACPWYRILEDDPENPTSIYDRLMMVQDVDKPSISELRDIFNSYKTQQITIQTSFIDEFKRKKNLFDRYYILHRKDTGDPALRALYPDIPNTLKYISDLIEDENSSQTAERLMSFMEQKQAEIDVIREQEELDIAERMQDIETIKNCVDIIQESDKSDWEKRLLIRMIKELK